MKKLDKLKDLDHFLGDLELGELNSRLYEMLLIDNIPTALHDETFFGSLFTYAEEMYLWLEREKHPELKSRQFKQTAVLQGAFCVPNMNKVFDKHGYYVMGQAEYIVCIAWAWLYVKKGKEKGVAKLLKLLKSECATLESFTRMPDFPLLFEKMKDVVDEYLDGKKDVKKEEMMGAKKMRQLEEIVKALMERGRKLTAENALLREELEAEKKKAETPKVEKMTPPWTLARGKQTSMAVVLATMHQAGWFVDEEEHPVKGRNQVIQDFMKQAFGRDVKNLDQLLSTTRRRNKAPLSSYFDELLNCLPNDY